jgi:predicted membrane channel-forming protein YqfA (hemolysin III family)
MGKIEKTGGKFFMNKDKQTSRSFFRESNVWRLIGGIVFVIGVILMVLFPSESYKDIILYRKYSDKGEVSIQVTVWHTIIITGMLAFIPTLKEFIHGFFRKGGNQNEEISSN